MTFFCFILKSGAGPHYGAGALLKRKREVLPMRRDSGTGSYCALYGGGGWGSGTPSLLRSLGKAFSLRVRRRPSIVSLSGPQMYSERCWFSAARGWVCGTGTRVANVRVRGQGREGLTFLMRRFVENAAQTLITPPS